MTLHPRGNDDRTGFGQRLRARRDVGYVAEYLTRHIDHHRPESIAMRAESAGLPAPSLLRLSSVSERCIVRAARAARSASFSCATG